MQSVTFNFRSRRTLTLVLLLLIAASVGMSVSAARLERFPGDLPVAEWVQSISVPMFDEVMRGVSGLGWWVPASIVTLTLALALAVLGLRPDAALLVLFVALSAGANWIAKKLIASPRPDPALLDVREDLATYGFPSGHVMFAVVCFGGLAIALSGVVGRYAAWARIPQVALILLAVIMAVSRVYLGSHWPSDAAGALLMGGAWLVVMTGAREWLQCKRLRVLESSRPP